MKKLLLIITVLVLSVAALQGQWINNTDNTSFNFRAPEGATAVKNEVLFPFYEVTTYSATNDTLTLDVAQYITIYNTSDTLIANTLFNLDIDSQLTAGSLLFIKAKSGAIARNFLAGTGITGTTVTGTSSKSKYLMFIYSGTSFIHVATQQID